MNLYSRVRCWTVLGIVGVLGCNSFVHADLADELKLLIDEHEGSVAVSVKHLGNGTTFVHRGDEVQATASLIKFPVLVELYRHRLQQARSGRSHLGHLQRLQKPVR